jgi:hypothetical protein
LPGDALDRDVVNVDLVALDQKKEEIERPFENFELNFVVSLHDSANSKSRQPEVNQARIDVDL